MRSLISFADAGYTIGLCAQFSERQRRSRDDGQGPFAEALRAIAWRRHSYLRTEARIRTGPIAK